METEFKIPQIPKILLSDPNKDAKSTRKSSKSRSRKQSKDHSNQMNVNGQQVQTNVKDKKAEINGTKSEQETPVIEDVFESTNEEKSISDVKLCSSCSLILLSYFQPLKNYINEICTIAEEQLNEVDRERYKNLTGQLELNKSSATVLLNAFNPIRTNERKEEQLIERERRIEEVKHENPNQFSSVDEMARCNHSDEVHQPNEHQPHDTYQDNQERKDYVMRNIVNSFKSEIQQNYDGQQNQQESHYHQTQHYEQQRAQGTNGEHYPTIDEQQQQQPEQHYSQNEAAQEDLSTSQDPEAPNHENENINLNQGESNEEPKNKETSANNVLNDKADSSKSMIEVVPSPVTSTPAIEIIKSPYAIVTIAYSNLSATNAIILVNSFHLTNNNLYTMKSKDDKRAYIPFVIIIGGPIDPLLRNAIDMIFDEVIVATPDLRLTLLQDKSIEVYQHKLNLWRSLIKYEKCLFLESSTLVVGHILSLFDECDEFAATVDWIFPDYFNCAVFMFRPNNDTYEELIKFAVSLQMSLNNENLDDNVLIDEMTLLNKFFANKWQRLSFIYNYVQNDAVYTQTPAFLRFGNTIKIVNFGFLGNNLISKTGHTLITVTQPWHTLFDLLVSSQSSEISTCFQINNYVRFYLSIFIQRLWPVMQKEMLPILSVRNLGRKDWTIFELIKCLPSSSFETADCMFNQHQITFRRIDKEDAQNRLTQVSIKSSSTDANLTDEQKTDDIEDKERTDNSIAQLTSEITKSIEISNSLEELSINSISEEVAKDITEEESKEAQSEEEIGSDKDKAAWESGRVDWMGVHRSDSIIERLIGKIGSIQ